MPVLEYGLFCVVSFGNVKNTGLLNVYSIPAINNLVNFHIAFRSLNFDDILFKLSKSRLQKDRRLIFPFDFLNSRMKWS